MTPTEFTAAVEIAFRKEFETAYMNAHVHKGLGYYICVAFGIHTKEQWFNGYFENDPATHKIMLHLDDDGNFKAGEGLELLTGGSIHVKPAADSHLAFDSVKVGWRNKKASPEKMLLHLTKYFKKLKTVAKENEKNIKG